MASDYIINDLRRTIAEAALLIAAAQVLCGATVKDGVLAVRLARAMLEIIKEEAK